MDNISSIVDGSIAIAGAIAIVAGSVWAMMASESRTAVDTKTADESLPYALKKGA